MIDEEWIDLIEDIKKNAVNKAMFFFILKKQKLPICLIKKIYKYIYK